MSYLSLSQIPTNVTNIIFEPHLDCICLTSNLFYRPVEWQFIASLNVLREHCRMMCLKGTLYVLGGIDIYEYIQLSVECYDPVENKWIKKTTIPVAMISQDNDDAFTDCVLIIKLSKGVLDKLNVIKE